MTDYRTEPGVKCIGTSSIGWSVRGCFPEPPYVRQFGCALLYTRTQQGYRQQTARPAPRLYRHAVFESGGLTEGWTQREPSAPREEIEFLSDIKVWTHRASTLSHMSVV